MIPGWYSDMGKSAALNEQVTGSPGRAAEAVRIMGEQAAIEAAGNEAAYGIPAAETINQARQKAGLATLDYAVTEIENETAAMREDAEQVAAYLATVNAAIVSAYGIPAAETISQARPAGSTCTCSAPDRDDYQDHPDGCPRRDELLVTALDGLKPPASQNPKAPVRAQPGPECHSQFPGPTHDSIISEGGNAIPLPPEGGSPLAQNLMEIRAKLLACGPVLTAGAALTGGPTEHGPGYCPGCGFWFSSWPGTTWPLPCCGYRSPAVTAAVIAAGTALTGGTAVYCTEPHSPGEPWACGCPPGSCKAREETTAQLNAEPESRASTPEEQAALIRAVIYAPLGLGEEDLPDYGIPGPLCCTGCLAPHAGPDPLCWYCTRLQRLTLPPEPPCDPCTCHGVMCPKLARPATTTAEPEPFLAWSIWYTWASLVTLMRRPLTRRGRAVVLILAALALLFLITGLAGA